MWTPGAGPGRLLAREPGRHPSAGLPGTPAPKTLLFQTRSCQAGTVLSGIHQVPDVSEVSVQIACHWLSPLAARHAQTPFSFRGGVLLGSNTPCWCFKCKPPRLLLEETVLQVQTRHKAFHLQEMRRGCAQRQDQQALLWFPRALLSYKYTLYTCKHCLVR